MAKFTKIRELNKEKNTFKWTPEHDKELKEKIMGARGVVAFNLEKKIEI